MVRMVKRMQFPFLLVALVIALVSSSCRVTGSGQWTERLDRGLVAVMRAEGGVFLSWRLLASDPEDVCFDLYRDGELVNTAGHLTTVTNFTDVAGNEQSLYELKSYSGGSLLATDKSKRVWHTNGLRIHMEAPQPTVSPLGDTITYSPNDCSVGDADGDGEYEIFLKWGSSADHDNSHGGYTGRVFIDCLKMDGTRLWRVDLGDNIRAGAHYTQFLVYDFDGDGCAELACKTAPGSVDGAGKYVTAAAVDDSIRNADNAARYANERGHIIEGPEYLTIFAGRDGKALSTVFYQPNRYIRALAKHGEDGTTRGAWGDGNGNRSERYLATVAYLPDEGGTARPSMVFCRGYYTYAFLWAVQFDGTELTTRWLYDDMETDYTTMYHAGAHSVMSADVDGDGYDEIIYGAATLNHDGTMLYNTGWGHGDALHVGDFNPDRPGLEVFMPHEPSNHAGLTHDSPRMDYGHELHDARTGEILVAVASDEDNGRGIAADIDPNYRGAEIWSLESNKVYDIHGNSINDSVLKRPQVNFRIYWDGDLQDELLDGGAVFRGVNPRMPRRDRPADPMHDGQGARAAGQPGDRGSEPMPPQQWQPDGQPQMGGPQMAGQQPPMQPFAGDPNGEANGKAKAGCSYIYKWDAEAKESRVLAELPATTINGTKRNPNFSGDILGDWREEVILTDGNDLVIFTTTIATEYRVPTLSSDHTYRMAMTSQNVAYNQPPHLGYYLPDLFSK